MPNYDFFPPLLSIITFEEMTIKHLMYVQKVPFLSTERACVVFSGFKIHPGRFLMLNKVKPLFQTRGSISLLNILIFQDSCTHCFGSTMIQVACTHHFGSTMIWHSCPNARIANSNHASNKTTIEMINNQQSTNKRLEQGTRQQDGCSQLSYALLHAIDWLDSLEWKLR